MNIWTEQEEAEKLKRRFAGVNRAKFAREHDVPGGQVMIYQHINGLRPISLAAAKAYARGFGCTLAEISPRLAEEIRGFDEPPAVRGRKEVSEWPFQFSLASFMELPEGLRAKAEGYIEGLIEQNKEEREHSSIAEIKTKSLLRA